MFANTSMMTTKNKPTIQESLQHILNDLKKMTPDQVRAELAKHTKGEFAQSMRETAEFLQQQNKS